MAQGDKHKLPQFPPGVSRTFKGLSEPLKPEEIPELRGILDRNLAELADRAKANERIDLALMYELADVAHYLLDQYDRFNTEQRAMVIGAVRYFAIAEDGLPDESYASGFDDDAEVMNYVLEQLGIEGKFLGPSREN